MANRNHNMELLSICLQMGWYGGRTMPVLLEGVPGTAKTQVIKQLGREFADYLAKNEVSDTFYTETVVIPQTMPETIEGIPSPDLESHSLVRLPLSGIRKLKQAGYGIWAGDEVTSGSQQTGAACMTLVQDGKAGDEVLPHTVGRVMMCNPEWCAAAGRELAPPEINRVCRIEWKLPNEDFLDFLAGGPGLMTHVRYLPQDWEDLGMNRARTLVRAYLKTNPKVINTMESGETTEAQASKPWASQRQWWNVTRLLAAIFALGEEPSSELAYLAVCGTVGEGVADQFVGWLREMDLPDPEKILSEAMKDKEGETRDDKIARIRKEIPDSVWRRADKLRLCLDSVAIAAQQDREDRADRWQAAWLVVEPVLDKKPDNAMSASQLLAERKPAGASIPEVAVKLWKAREKAGLMRSKARSSRK